MDMDLFGVFLFVGLIMCGVMIGYPLGHIFGKREAAESFACGLHKTYEPCRPVRRRRRKHVRNILEAEILLEKETNQ